MTQVNSGLEVLYDLKAQLERSLEAVQNYISVFEAVTATAIPREDMQEALRSTKEMTAHRSAGEL